MVAEKDVEALGTTWRSGPGHGVPTRLIDEDEARERGARTEHRGRRRVRVRGERRLRRRLRLDDRLRPSREGDGGDPSPEHAGAGPRDGRPPRRGRGDAQGTVATRTVVNPPARGPTGWTMGRPGFSLSSSSSSKKRSSGWRRRTRIRSTLPASTTSSTDSPSGPRGPGTRSSRKAARTSRVRSTPTPTRRSRSDRYIEDVLGAAGPGHAAPAQRHGRAAAGRVFWRERPDFHPVIGKAPGVEGMILCYGFSGHGFRRRRHRRLVAELILDGRRPRRLPLRSSASPGTLSGRCQRDRFMA